MNMTKRKDYLKQKLVGAVTMLVIASILLVSSSYAWFVMSTAPEVSNITTQVGANGALEIALLNDESWNDLSLLDMGDIDESAAASTLNANLTWGNLVNLGDPSYGLSNIILQPARLAIAANGNDADGNPQYKVNSTMLKVPEYGEDGRIQRLDTTSAVAYTFDGTAFSSTGYGVRAIGTSAQMNGFQLGMNTARSLLVTNISSARNTASNALNTNGNAIAGIVIDHSVNNSNSFSVENVTSVKALATGLSESFVYLEAALRQAFAGYITTAGSGVTAENYAAKLAEVADEETSLSSLLDAYPGITSMIPDMGTYITKLTEDQNKINTCISSCDAKIAAGAASTWAEISNMVRSLADTDSLTVSGKTMDELKASLYDESGQIDYGGALSLLQGGIVIIVPSGSGVLSDIADYAGDYTANVTVENFAYDGHDFGNVSASMKTATNANPVYLTVCNNALRGGTVTEGAGSNAMTDYYGYCLDLAFKTNAEESNLLLQTESVNRIYEDGESSLSLQGGGSYMSFITNSGISAYKMVQLMKGIRVVLMDDSQNVLAIATLDMTLGKNAYTLVEEENRTEDVYAYLDNGNAHQLSDEISQSEYEALPEKSNVKFDKTAHTVMADLYLHDFSLTVSTQHTAEEIAANGGDFYTGGITIADTGKSGNNAIISALEQDTVKRISVLVYLDGSTVTNASVAANSAQSMTGKLNLQFSSSATLVPAENTKLRNMSVPVSVEVGETTNLSIMSRFISGDITEVTWESNDINIATVTGTDLNATVTGVGDGEATITATIKYTAGDAEKQAKVKYTVIVTGTASEE